MVLDTLELTPQEAAQVELIREALSQDFRPFAVFDEPLDCIRVCWRDCSVTEIRVNDLLTVLEENYPVNGSAEIVGFTIKGVAHICETYGIPSDAAWKLADFLDAVLTASAPREQLIVRNVVKPMVAQRNLTDIEKVAA